MKTINFIVSIFLGLVINLGAFAQSPGDECESLDLNSITYIEDENEFDLGFDTEEYLPVDFDPYSVYVDLNSIEFIHEEMEVLDYSAYLPTGFDAYAFPSYFRSIDYVDPTDEFTLDIDTAEYLPEGFDPYEKESDTKFVSL